MLVRYPMEKSNLSLESSQVEPRTTISREVAPSWNWWKGVFLTLTLEGMLNLFRCLLGGASDVTSESRTTAVFVNTQNPHPHPPFRTAHPTRFKLTPNILLKFLPRIPKVLIHLPHPFPSPPMTHTAPGGLKEWPWKHSRWRLILLTRSLRVIS